MCIGWILVLSTASAQLPLVNVQATTESKDPALADNKRSDNIWGNSAEDPPVPVKACKVAPLSAVDFQPKTLPVDNSKVWKLSLECCCMIMLLAVDQPVDAVLVHM